MKSRKKLWDGRELERYLDDAMSPVERSQFDKGLEENPLRYKTVRFFQSVRLSIKESIDREMAERPTQYLWESIRADLAPKESLMSLVQKKAFRWRAAQLICVLCLMVAGTYSFFEHKVSVNVANECYVEYLENRTNHVMIFKGSDDGLTYIWIQENQDPVMNKNLEDDKNLKPIHSFGFHSRDIAVVKPLRDVDFSGRV